MSENKKTFERKYRAGGVVATIWKNTTEKDGQKYDNYSISVERSYKDNEGNWQQTNSMNVSDLPKVEMVCNEAYNFILMKVEEPKTE